MIMTSSNLPLSPPPLPITLPADVLELIVRECHLMDQRSKEAKSTPVETLAQREEYGGQPRLLSKLRLTNKTLMRMASKYLFKVVKASRCNDPIFRFSIATNYSTLVQGIIFDDTGRKAQGVESVEILLSFLPFFVNLRSAFLTRNGFSMFAPPPAEPSSSSHGRKTEIGTDANYLLRRQALNDHTLRLTSLHLQENYPLGTVVYWLSLCNGKLKELRLEGNQYLRPKDEAAFKKFQKWWPCLTKKMVELDLDRQMGEGETKRRNLGKIQETFPDWFLETPFPPLVRLTLRCLNLDQNDKRFFTLFQDTLKHLIIEQNMKSHSKHAATSIALPHLPRLETLRLIGRSQEIDATFRSTLDDAGDDSPRPFPSLRSLSLHFADSPSAKSLATIEAFVSRHIQSLGFLEWSRKDGEWSQIDLDKVKTWSLGNLQINLSSSPSRSSRSTESSHSSNSSHPFHFSHAFFARDPSTVENYFAQPITGSKEDEKIAQRQNFVEELRNTAAYGRRALEIAAGRKDVVELQKLAVKLGSLEAERSADFV